MFGLRIGTDFLDLFPDTAINCSLSNPVFDRDSVARVFSYPFKLPTTAKNKLLLGQLDRLDSSIVNFSVEAELWIQRLPFESGVIKVGNSAPDFFNIRFENKEQSLMADAEKVKINEILDTINIAYTAPTEALFSINEDGPYHFPIDEFTFTCQIDSPTVSEDIVEAIHEYYPGFATQSNEDHIHLDLTLYPDAFVHYDLMNGFTLISGGDNTVTAKHQAFLDYITAIHATPAASHAFPMIFNFGFYGKENPGFYYYINFYKDGAFLENVLEDDRQWIHTFTPFVRMPYLVEKILEHTEVNSIEGDFYELADTQALVVYNNKALDEVAEVDYVGGGISYFNHYKLSFSLNDHVPEMTGKELLTRFFEAFQLYPMLSGTKLVIHKKKDQLNNKPIDWTKKTEPEFSKNMVERIGFTLDYTEDDKDAQKVPGKLEPFVIDPGEERIDLPFGTIHETVRINGPAGASTWLTGIVDQPGSSDVEGIGKQPFTFRLFFDRGLQLDGESLQYPLGTHGNKDFAGDTIGEYSLALEGEDGLYETCYKGILELQQKDTVTRTMRLNIEDLIEVRKWTNPIRYIYDERGAMTGIITNIQFKASAEGISVSKVDLIKL